MAGARRRTSDKLTELDREVIALREREKELARRVADLMMENERLLGYRAAYLRFAPGGDGMVRWWRYASDKHHDDVGRTFWLYDGHCWHTSASLGWALAPAYFNQDALDTSAIFVRVPDPRPVTVARHGWVDRTEPHAILLR